MEIVRIVVGPLQCNSYLISSNNEGIIIDPGDEGRKIVEEVKELKIKFILLTHNHPDHISALEEVKEEVKAKCGIHYLDDIGKIIDFKFKDGEEFEFGREKIKVIHTPGHTPGGSCFLIKNNLFSGDTLFKLGYGRTDLIGGDESKIFESINKLLTLPGKVKVYPGHGPSTTIEEERNLYLRE